MGPKPKYDWTALLAMYIRGATTPQIAAQCNVPLATVRGHALRHKWGLHRSSAATLVAINAIKKSEKGLKQRGLAVLEELQNDVENSVKTNKNLPKPKSWTQAEVKERTMKQLTDRAMRTAGLDQPGSLTLISIDRLSVQTHGQNDSDMSAIDVETVEKTPNSP